MLFRSDCHRTPFGDEFDYAILDSIDLGPGQFAEVAFLHRQSRTLLVTDSIISIPIAPPPIVRLDPRPLLFHARDRGTDSIPDTPANQLQGWQRICLFALYFQPSSLEIRKWDSTWRESFTASDRSRQNYFGLYPFEWRSGWQEGFKDLRDCGKLLVAPILQTLILNRAPQETRSWVDRVAKWEFDRIIPCHFDAPIAATPDDFRAAFDFLVGGTPGNENPHSPNFNLPKPDLRLLQQIDRFLVRWRIIFPSQDRR